MLHYPLFNIKCLLPQCLLFCLTGCSETPSLHEAPNSPSGQLAGGVTFYQQKITTPVIVLQSGLGDGIQAWDQVMPEFAKHYSVLAFDRPGRGNQPATDASRDPCTIAREQHALLVSAGAKPPYLLVGHSLGGLYQYAYAQLFPAEVAGMVLVDPTPPHHWETMQREAPESASMLKVMRFVGFSRTDKREFDQQSECLDKLMTHPPVDKPIRVLVAGRFTGLGESGDFEKMLKKSRLQWLKLTGASQLDTVWDSGHYIQKESPEVVIEAVQHVYQEAQGRDR